MEDIELRSEQVRKIIGQIPPVLVRSGISIIGLIVALLLAVATFVPYPETIETNITLTNIHEGHAFAKGRLPYSYISQVKKDMNIIIELEGYSNGDYSSLQGYIEAVLPKVITVDGQNYFNITLKLKEIPFMQKGMKGKASIILSEKTLLKRVLK